MINRELRAETLERFIDCKIEIRCNKKNYAFGGRISAITLNSKKILHIKFKWKVKSIKGIPAFYWTKRKYSNKKELGYDVNVSKITFPLIGKGRYCVYVPKTDEVIIFYPSNEKELGTPYGASF